MFEILYKLVTCCFAEISLKRLRLFYLLKHATISLQSKPISETEVKDMNSKADLKQSDWGANVMGKI